MTALAGDDNVAFSFTMKANLAKSYTGDRYRETTRTNNPWKVNMTGSTEGKHTQAYYFLASNGIRRRPLLQSVCRGVKARSVIRLQKQ